jgi:hypothetical protein
MENWNSSVSNGLMIYACELIPQFCERSKSISGVLHPGLFLASGIVAVSRIQFVEIT